MVGVCDFCSKPGPRWSYPCDSFTIGPYGSVGPWAACFDCHVLIERARYDRVLDRAMGSKTGPGRAQLAGLLRAFKQHRCGPGVRLW